MEYCRYLGLSTISPDDMKKIAREAPHITVMELSSNNLTDLPDEVALLRYVRKLHMKYNKLTSLPSILTKFQQLQVPSPVHHIVIWCTDVAYMQSSLHSAALAR